MNTVIETLMGLLNQAKVEDLQKGIQNARQLHDEYILELGRAYGVTFVAPPTGSPSRTRGISSS